MNLRKNVMGESIKKTLLLYCTVLFWELMLSCGSLLLPNVPTLSENICSPTSLYSSHTSLYSSHRSKLELWNQGTVAIHQHWTYGTTFVCLDSVEEEEKAWNK